MSFRESGIFVGSEPNITDGVIEVYHNGELREKKSLKDNKLDGVYEEYWSNGQLKEKSFWKNGDRTGILEKYYQNGQLAERRNNDIESGVCLEVYSAEGNLLAKETCNSDHTAVYEERFLNGSLKFLNSHKNGKLHGLFECYYDNGILMRKGYYKEGHKDGVWEEFYPNGKIQKSFTYRLDKWNGYFVRYYENGNKKNEGYFCNDRINGSYLEYDETGKLIKTSNYRNGCVVSSLEMQIAKAKAFSGLSKLLNKRIERENF